MVAEGGGKIGISPEAQVKELRAAGGQVLVVTNWHQKGGWVLPTTDFKFKSSGDMHEASGRRFNGRRGGR